ncbi:MAG: hypothetical protein ACRBDL_01290 [Alphaproteobacteria bacterium]
MCYQVFVSTNCSDDIGNENSQLVKFTKELPFAIGSELLRYQNVWYIDSESGGCSCSFRHANDPKLGFGVPEDWYPEDDVDIKATIGFIKTIRAILQAGFHVDCIDIWNDNSSIENPPEKILVNLLDLKNEEFRFFENHIFEFTLSDNDTPMLEGHEDV